eukprot:gene10113-433_t
MADCPSEVSALPLPPSDIDEDDFEERAPAQEALEEAAPVVEHQDAVRDELSLAEPTPASAEKQNDSAMMVDVPASTENQNDSAEMNTDTDPEPPAEDPKVVLEKMQENISALQEEKEIFQTELRQLKEKLENQEEKLMSRTERNIELEAGLNSAEAERVRVIEAGAEKIIAGEMELVTKESATVAARIELDQTRERSTLLESHISMLEGCIQRTSSKLAEFQETVHSNAQEETASKEQLILLQSQLTKLQGEQDAIK